MRRFVLTCFSVGVLMAFASSAEAAVIVPCSGGGPPCVAIAEFSWVIDGFGDTFELENLSGAIAAGDFTGASVTVDAGEIVNFPDDPLAAGLVSSVFPLSAAQNSVAVAFTYQGLLFEATITSAQLVDDPFEGTRFFSTFLHAERSAPEPSTLLLLSLAGAAVIVRRQRVHALR